jgi:hypothetical protein
LYQGFDGTDWSVNTSMVIINVAPVNDPPTPETDYYLINEDQQLAGVSVKTNELTLMMNVLF